MCKINVELLHVIKKFHPYEVIELQITVSLKAKLELPISSST
jgi:hypothetical protein